MFCHKCGKENGDSRFCIHCGAELPKMPESPASEPAAVQPTVDQSIEPAMSEPIAAPLTGGQPIEPIVGEPSAAQLTTDQSVEPAMNEPVAAQPTGDQPIEPYASELPIILPTNQVVEPYASESPAVQIAYSRPEMPYMGEPPLVQMMSMQPQTPPRKKTKVGLIIGIIAAALAVLAGAAVLLFYTMTFPVEGQWYNEERGEVLVFGEDGTVEVISLMGTQDGDFEHSRLKGEGLFSVGEASYDFESDEEEIYIDDLGTYIRAEEDFTAEAFLDDFGWLGTWYSEDRGEVIVFGTKGAVECISLISSQDSTYEYSYQDGSGTLTLGIASYDISIKNGQMNVSGIGGYAMADDSFDSAAFIDEFGQLGTWYCEDRGEVLVFDMSGTVKSRHASCTNNASFVFDPESFVMTLTVGPFTYEGKIEDGQLVTEGMGTFVQAKEDFNEEVFFEDFGNSVLGIWYDKEGELTIDLHEDGTYDAISYGKAFSGEYTRRDSGATIYFEVLDDVEFNEEYSLVGGDLVKKNAEMTDAADTLIREVADQFGEEDYYQDLSGSWYPVEGNGTLKFSDEMHVSLVAGGQTFSGTYTYDPLTGLGLIYMLGETTVFVTDGTMLYWLDILFAH